MALFRRNKGSFGHEVGPSYPLYPDESRSSQPVQRAASGAPKWFSPKQTPRAEPEIRLRGSFLPEELSSNKPGWIRRLQARIDAPPPSAPLKPAAGKLASSTLIGQDFRDADATPAPMKEPPAPGKRPSLPEATKPKAPVSSAPQPVVQTLGTANEGSSGKQRDVAGAVATDETSLASARPGPLPEAPRPTSPAFNPPRPVAEKIATVRNDGVTQGWASPAVKPAPVIKVEQTQRRWFGARQPKGSSEAAREGTRRSDLTIAGLGITLGFICALFPWYIFFNPEKFGPPAMKFEGGGDTTGLVSSGPQPQRVGAPMNVEDVPVMQLDLFATGTVPKGGGEDDAEAGSPPPGVEEQPFPAEIPQFKLVHVANGRAMIEDDTGLWIVQRGSTLPDSSKVEGIEQRDGKWALVTSNDQVIELTP